MGLRDAAFSPGRVARPSAVLGKRVVEEVIIVLDDDDAAGAPSALTSLVSVLDVDMLEMLLVALLRLDKAAPRTARVDKAWARGMSSALRSFAGTGHRWWSAPFPPIRPERALVSDEHMRLCL